MKRSRKAAAKNELDKAIASAKFNEGDIGDGGIVVFANDGHPDYYVPCEITRALRYALGRLQASEKGDVPSRIAVTSALAGEGVTFVATSLAALLANDLRRSVCLVDLNWWATNEPGPKGRRAKIAQPTPVPPGVAQLIDGTASLADVLVTTRGQKLAIISAGRATVGNRPVLARDDRLTFLIDELSLRFDHVVLDLPPVLTTGEAITLANLAKAFIMVVQQGVTAEQQVKEALNELRHLDALGLVLNRAASNVPARLARLLAS